MRKLPVSPSHLLLLVVFQLALYLPLIGRGLVFDDFQHVYSAAHEPISHGLTRVQGGPFYDPVAWLAFKLDWMLWRGRSFPMAAENLLVHIANTLLLYLLALGLLKSQAAAWWTALGFALLFPANTWTVMYIATRAHLLSTFSYLAALIAALWYVHTPRNRTLAGMIVIVCSSLSMFAKENGVTVIAAVLIILVHQRQSLKQKIFRPADILLSIALLGLLTVYLGMRSQSGAISPTVPNENYNYALSATRLVDNVLRYTWRTYGLLAILAAALTASQCLRGLHPSLPLVRGRDVWLSLTLFAVGVAPFVLLSVRSATYSYLPGIGAALLLGAVARSLHAGNRTPWTRHAWLTSSPVLLVVGMYAAFTVGQSWKWVRMGEVSRAVLDQIAVHQPEVEPNAFVALKYSDVDREHRFPNGFPGRTFSFAVRLLYNDSSLDGSVIRHGEAYSIGEKRREIQFEYVLVNGKPTIRKILQN